MGFQDCKVFIHSVDAQSSANGGITILVIGEMSNQDGPWRKFVQSFFLAEQPNGYFVHNDIFRFLREDTYDNEDQPIESENVSHDTEPTAPAAVPAAPPAPHQPTPAPTPPPAFDPQPPSPVPAYDHHSSVVDEPAPVPVPEPTPQVPDSESESQPQANGIHQEGPDSKASQVPLEEPVLTQPDPQPVSTANETLLPAPSAPDPPLTYQQQQQQPQSSTQPVPVQVAPAPAPAPAPSAPKTWANLAATNPKKWGSAVAQESRGTTEVPAASTPPGSGTHTPATPHGHGAHRGPSGQHSHAHGSGREHPAVVAAQNVTTAQCFVKVRHLPLLFLFISCLPNP
jgi:Nuclear transport factor 2 (NTF2) domain